MSISNQLTVLPTLQSPVTFSGYHSDLYNQTIHAYQNSVAPGTIANRCRQAKIYNTFSLLYGVNYLKPSCLEAAMYIQYLANTYPAPNTIKNYMSGARNWILSHKGDDSAFASLEAASVLSYNVKKSAHVQAQAYPISLSDLTNICEFIDSSTNVPLAVKPAILIGYFAFLRVSNLLAPSLNVWTGPHNLAVSNVLTNHDSIVICLRSTKMISLGKPTLIPIYKVPNSTCYPVMALQRYVTVV